MISSPTQMRYYGESWRPDPGGGGMRPRGSLRPDAFLVGRVYGTRRKRRVLWRFVPDAIGRDAWSNFTGVGYVQPLHAFGEVAGRHTRWWPSGAVAILSFAGVDPHAALFRFGSDAWFVPNWLHFFVCWRAFAAFGRLGQSAESFRTDHEGRKKRHLVVC